jgi:hypothetical protein
MANLSLRAFSVDDVDIDAVVHELVEQVPSAFDGLHKDQHGRFDALLHQLTHGQQLAALVAHEH